MNKIALPDITTAYSGASFLQRFMVRHRPDICPPDPFYSDIPQDASVLDVGCGMGTHLVTLSMMGRITSGYGVDVSHSAISQAKLAAAQTPNSNLEFSTIDDVNQIPNREFDVVMMVDVMHHVPIALRERTFAACVARTKATGTLIFKDMADAPPFHATANRLHDLLMAKEIIHYLPLETVIRWGNEAQLTVVDRVEYKRLLYAHEMIAFRKNTPQ